jgi:hypothetical protein
VSRCGMRRSKAKSLPYRHYGAPCEARGKFAHVGGGDSDAAGGWSEAGAGEVEEDRAAASLGATRIILVEHEGQIIKMIVAPHAVGAIGGGQAHRAIVTRARRVLAPALVAADGLQRHARGARSQTVWPVIAPQDPEPSGRRALVALPLDPDNSRRSERARDAERPSRQPAPRTVSGNRADAQKGQAPGRVHCRYAGRRAMGARDVKSAPRRIRADDAIFTLGAFASRQFDFRPTESSSIVLSFALN